jgi:hypothetical protein
MGTFVSQHGRAFGFDSTHGSLQRPGFSDTFEDDESVTAPTTSANIKWRGVATLSTTGARAHTLNAPPYAALGVLKRLICTTTSTANATTVTLASGNFQSTAGSSFTKLTFQGLNHSVLLQALSTALVSVMSNAGVTLST